MVIQNEVVRSAMINLFDWCPIAAIVLHKNDTSYTTKHTIQLSRQKQHVYWSKY